MGNECIKAVDEDKGVSKMGMQAVGAGADEINDATLNLCLGGDMNALKQRVGLTFHCTNLPNLDSGSKSDAFVVLWDVSNPKQKRKVGQTELIPDNLSPQFVTEIMMDYFFEVQQSMLVEVYDADDATNLANLQKQEFLGSFEFKLAKLCSAPNQELMGDLHSTVRANSGQIKIMAEEKKPDYGKNLAHFSITAGLQ